MKVGVKISLETHSNKFRFNKFSQEDLIMNAKSIFTLCMLAIALIVGVISAQGLGSDAQAKPIQNGADGANGANKQSAAPAYQAVESTTQLEEKKLETASLAGGCFWCVEAVFQKLKGVESVQSGYMGGHKANPTYKQVLTGRTGHAEMIQIEFDPSVISFKELLEVFWKTHDPTTLNRQGADVGTQYRSAIFYNNETQKELAEEYKKKLNESGAFASPIVTEITAASEFTLAERYHQNFWNTKGKKNNYCRAVIPAKLNKLQAVFADKLKE